MDLPVKYAPADGAVPPGDFVEPGGELSPIQTAFRHKWAILAFAVVMAAIAAVIVKHLPSSYTSAASVAFDVEQLNVLGTNGAFQNPDLNSEVMMTEMAALESPVIAQTVVRELGLRNQRAFMDCKTTAGFLDRLKAKVGLATLPQTCTSDVDFAARKLVGTVMTFSNDRQSYVAKLAATTGDPVLSANIANAYANAYVAWRITNRDQRAGEADKWLSSYLDTLRGKMTAANDAVAAYRIEHHLVSAGPTAPGTSPMTVVGQSLTQLNAQLTETDAELAARESVLAQTHGAGGALATATALQSPVVQSLLEQQAAAEANLASLRARFGEDHPKVLAAAADLGRINAQLNAQTGRAVSSLQNEVDGLRGRRAALQKQVESLEGSVSDESQSDVRLGELERQADTENSLYRTMLDRMKEIDATRHTEIADASVVVPAEPIYAPTSPHRAMLVAGAFLASLGIGAGLALARDLTAARFRDIRQLEAETGLPLLGVFAQAPRGVPPRDMVFDRPFSVEVEMLNAILARIENESDRSAGGRTMLITSALPSEGKSSFSVSLGRLAAQAGLRTLLIDGDLRRSSLQALMDSGRKPATGEVARMDGLTVDSRSGLALLSLRQVVGDARRIVAARGVAEFIAELRTRYDLILIDTPPVLAVPDTGSLTAFADDVIVAVDWSQATREAVDAAVDELRRIRAHVAGIVVTKIGLKTYARIATSSVHDIRRYREYLPQVTT